jgi:chemotaxis protein CheD
MPTSSAPRQTQVVVGVADLKVTNLPNALVITYALGSCLGVTVYDRVLQAGGMLHALLPDSSTSARRDAPEAMFVEAGMARLLDAMSELGSQPDHREFKVFGGAQVLGASDFLSIGARNVATMKKLALLHRLHVTRWDVGGQTNRTIQLYLDNGDVAVRMPGRKDVCL